MDLWSGLDLALRRMGWTLTVLGVALAIVVVASAALALYRRR